MYKICRRNFQLFPDKIQDFHEINERFGLFFEFSISLEMVNIVRNQILQISENFYKMYFCFSEFTPNMQGARKANYSVFVDSKNKERVRKKMFSNSIKLIRNCQLISARNYAFKSDLKIKWNRPEKISCIKPEKSGDKQPLENVKEKYILGFEESKEFQE